jgi:hypothetical protein
MVAHWLDQLRGVLSEFYPPEGPANVVGYLKGSDDPNVWRIKALQYEKPQMLVLGNTPPDAQRWVDAGKFGPADGPVSTVYPEKLNGFIIIYGGFGPLPWGRIELLDNDALTHYQSSTIDAFRNAILRHRRR